MKTTRHRLLLPLYLFFIVATPTLSFSEESTLPKFLSRDELRACRKEDARIKEQEPKFEKIRKELETELDGFSVEAATLAAMIEALSKKQTEAGLEAYNKRVNEHNRRVEDHRKRTLEFNVMINEYNSERAANMKMCATRPFKLEDDEALKDELDGK